MQQRKSIALAPVVLPWDHSQIVRHMETADDRANQRDYVIDLVTNAGGLRQINSGLVEAENRRPVCPRWCSKSSAALSSGYARIDTGDIGLSPLLVVLALMLGVFGSPFQTVCASLVLIVLVPFGLIRRMLRLPFARPFIGALTARVAQSIGLSFALGECGAIFGDSADIARLRHGVSL